jgi:hypothetical protein
MAHHLTIKQNSYYKLTERINRFPQGAPPSDLLFEILKILFSEREAGLVSLLPIKPFNAHKAAKIWKMKPEEARTMAAVLGVILKLPPAKQAVAGRQFKSRYLEGLIRRQKNIS